MIPNSNVHYPTKQIIYREGDLVQGAPVSDSDGTNGDIGIVSGHRLYTVRTLFVSLSSLHTRSFRGMGNETRDTSNRRR